MKDQVQPYDRVDTGKMYLQKEGKHHVNAEEDEQPDKQ